MQAIRRTKSLLAWALCALGLSIANQANAAVICAYDPAGKSGDYYALLSDFAIESASWGTEVEIKAYTDEETAAKVPDDGGTEDEPGRARGRRARQDPPRPPAGTRVHAAAAAEPR